MSRHTQETQLLSFCGMIQQNVLEIQGCLGVDWLQSETCFFQVFQAKRQSNAFFVEQTYSQGKRLNSSDFTATNLLESYGPFGIKLNVSALGTVGQWFYTMPIARYSCTKGSSNNSYGFWAHLCNLHGGLLCVTLPSIDRHDIGP